MSESYERPIPVPDLISQGFWDGTAVGELRIQRCPRCGHFQFYPRAWCMHCTSLELDWYVASGRGSIHTYTVIRRHTAPAWKTLLPYVVAIVALEEGPRLMTNIVDCDPESVYVEMPVQARLTPITQEIALPLFAPAAYGI
jgi:uncharacterized OB-fold protein